MSVAIEVENLGKAYQLGQFNTGSLSQDLKRWWAIKRGKEDPFARVGEGQTQNLYIENNISWSLKDVSFQIKQGDAVGIVGKNGAGKSTLLKILSQVTGPTTGLIKIQGRIASLLEVGTGFHPELTGRENIFLNGAILGLRKREIKAKLDEIIAFSGVDKYIDTPVKRYSSGMYVRLAFAVAAHLESEIMIVDEVLAVGDAEFQKKCLGKMDEVSKGEGRTVLFVSHNMAAVRKLCNKSILLQNGMKVLEGNTNNVIDHYLSSNVQKQNLFSPIYVSEIQAVVTKIAINENQAGKVFPLQPLQIDIEIECQRDIDNIGIQILLSHEHTEGQVFSSNSKQTKGIDIVLKKGKNHIICFIEQFNLCSGNYQLGFAIDTPFVKFHYLELNLFSFDVLEVISENSSLPTLPSYGHVYLDHHWTIK